MDWNLNCYQESSTLCYHLRWRSGADCARSVGVAENFSAVRSEVETFSEPHRLLSVENDKV